MKKYSLYIIVILIVVTALGLVKFLPLKNTQEQVIPFIASSALNLINEKCTEDENNVYMTECAINLLDRVASEREWKQRKLETIKHPQVNINELGPDLADIQKKIRDWRDGFEKARDNKCEAMLAFSGGSGTPYGIALCKIDVELVAINELDELYYATILKDIYGSEGISDFEPTDSDIEEIMKVNATSRGCVWADDEACGLGSEGKKKERTNIEEEFVERYGVLHRSSTSGDMRFNYYDIQQKKVLDTFDGHPWFFALKDESMTDEYLQYLQENKGAVFKIVGKKLADDCDYYGNGSCLENIAVEKIEVAK